MLELRNVSFQVSEDSTDKEILKNVSFTLEDNKFVAITGPNGGGKSTLARMIAGIIKPVSGSILLDGQDITNLSVTERARLGISYAFQQPVRFKGITVLICCAWRQGNGCPPRMPASIFPRWACAPRTISTGK